MTGDSVASDLAMPRIEVYAVGLRADIRDRRLRRGFRDLRYWVANGNFRAVRNYFNGYLAEPCPFPEGVRRCGSGWTAERAYRDLQRRMARAGRGRGDAQ